MGPEKGEYSDQEGDHEFGGHPHVRILVDIMGGAVGMEFDKAFGCFFVAGLAGFQTIVSMYLGDRIVNTGCFVMSMAIEALGGVGPAKGGHLTMVGIPVAFALFFVLVAAAAVSGNQQLGGVGLQGRNIMGERGVAVDARGRVFFGIPINGQAMHRIAVILQLLFMATATSLMGGHAKGLSFLAFHGEDIVGVVAIGTGRVRFGRVVFPWQGVDGGHVMFGAFDQDAEPSGLAQLLGVTLNLPPDLGMAFDAIDSPLQVLAVG